MRTLWSRARLTFYDAPIVSFSKIYHDSTLLIGGKKKGDGPTNDARNYARDTLPRWRKMAAPGRPSDSRAPPILSVTNRPFTDTPEPSRPYIPNRLTLKFKQKFNTTTNSRHRRSIRPITFFFYPVPLHYLITLMVPLSSRRFNNNYFFFLSILRYEIAFALVSSLKNLILFRVYDVIYRGGKKKISHRESSCDSAWSPFLRATRITKRSKILKYLFDPIIVIGVIRYYGIIFRLVKIILRLHLACS